MQTCIFCGAQDPVHCKLLSHSFVWQIVQRQKDAGISEPIVNFMCSHISAEMHKVSLALAASATSEETELEENDDLEDNNNNHLQSCMCCYYWVARRQKQHLVPLPMQNLLWYVRTLKGCEKKKCDSRILLRLVKTITESGNMYARFFELSELRGMTAIKELSRKTSTTAHMQGDGSFCVKKQLAALWHSNNGQSILIAHSHAADLLR